MPRLALSAAAASLDSRRTCLPPAIAPPRARIRNHPATLATATHAPRSLSQILLHPYVYNKQKIALLDYHKEHGIVTEAYSSLKPLTDPAYSGGPVDKAIAAITKVRGISAAAVLFAWARSKGAVIVTTSSKKERLIDYVAAGEVELTAAEILTIDVAGSSKSLRMWQAKKRAAPLLAATAGLALLKWYFA